MHTTFFLAVFLTLIDWVLQRQVARPLHLCKVILAVTGRDIQIWVADVPACKHGSTNGEPYVVQLQLGVPRTVGCLLVV